MAVQIVDASALGALIFGEPRAAAIAERLSEGPLVAPALIWFELASICLKKIKAHPDLEDQILQAFHLAGNLDIEIIEVDHSEVVQLAREHNLTTYDANYLWLARLLKGRLVTLDERLLKEARK